MLCEHTFAITSEGHTWARFRRALDSRSATVALAAAHEVENVRLAEAAELVVLLGRERHPRFRAAARRWHARYIAEVHGVDDLEAVAVLALLLMLDAPRRRAAAVALANLIESRELRRVTEAILRASGVGAHGS